LTVLEQKGGVLAGKERKKEEEEIKPR